MTVKYQTHSYNAQPREKARKEEDLYFNHENLNLSLGL